MKKSEVTERMKGLMSDPDREALFGADHPPGPHNAKQQPKDTESKFTFNAEKKEHQILEDWLNRPEREWFYDHQRMDRRTTNKKGIPDFVIGVCGQLVCIEFKLHGRKLTPEQIEWRRRAEKKSKCQYYVYDNAGEAIVMLREMDATLRLWASQIDAKLKT